MTNVYADLENALLQHQRALEIRTRVFGSEHPGVATSKYNIAGLKEAQGDLEEARSLFLECEQIYANVLGVDHEETLDAAMRAHIGFLRQIGKRGARPKKGHGRSSHR